MQSTKYIHVFTIKYGRCAYIKLYDNLDMILCNTSKCHTIKNICSKIFVTVKIYKNTNKYFKT